MSNARLLQRFKIKHQMSRRGSSVQAFFEAVGSQLPPNIPIQNKKNFKRKSKDKESLDKEKELYCK